MQRPDLLANAAATQEREHARQQIQKRRVGERDRGVDVPAVEEHKRDRERQQHEQVEVKQREGPAEVKEGENEQQTQRQPDVEGVDVFADVAGVPARERPLPAGSRSTVRAPDPTGG